MRASAENRVISTSVPVDGITRGQQSNINRHSVLFAVLGGLVVQFGGGIIMGMFSIRGNIPGVMAALVVTGLVSAFATGSIATALSSGHKQKTECVKAILVLVLASSLNNIFTGQFDLGGLFFGIPLALATGYLGAGAVVLIRRVS